MKKAAQQGYTAPPPPEGGPEDGLMDEIEFKSSNSQGSSGNEWMSVELGEDTLLAESIDPQDNQAENENEPEQVQPLYPEMDPTPSRISIGRNQLPANSNNDQDTQSEGPSPAAQPLPDPTPAQPSPFSENFLNLHYAGVTSAQQDPYIQSNVMAQVAPNVPKEDKHYPESDTGSVVFSQKDAKVFESQQVLSRQPISHNQNKAANVSITVQPANTVKHFNLDRILIWTNPQSPNQSGPNQTPIQFKL